MTGGSRIQRDLVLAAAAGVAVAGAAHGLSRVFVEGTWRGETYLAILLALAIAAAARRLGVGAIVSAVASLLGFAAFTYVAHLPGAPLVPGSEQVRQLVDLANAGLLQSRDEPAPTVPLDGLMLLVTSGAWFVTYVTHELLVRWRRTGLSLLPPLFLWAVPLAAPQEPGRTWFYALPFLAGAGLVLLVDSDGDIRGWVREQARPRLSGAGMGLGAMALIAAAVVPGILPGYQDEPWWDLNGRNDARGYQPIVDVGDRLRLPAERPVMSVEADRKVYLRLAALETFDRNTWRIGPPGEAVFRPEPDRVFDVGRGPLPPETEIAQGEEVEVSIEILDLENIYLPVPYQPVRVTEDGNSLMYSLEGGFVASNDTTDNEIGGRPAVGVLPGMSFEVVSVVPDPAPDDLRSVEAEPTSPAVSRFTHLEDPARFNRFREQAETVYAAAGAETAYDRALALQRWFTDSGTFRYSTTEVGQLRGEQALETFVFSEQVGYCEYFASAMAVMLRATGIPARVAVGFLPGDLTYLADPALQRFRNTYEVMTSDAHAWVEVLFPGYGWIKFDPTPRSDGGTMPPTADEVDPLATVAEQESGTSGDPRDRPAVGPDRLAEDAFLDRLNRLDEQVQGSGGAGGGLSLPLGWLALAAVLSMGGGLAIAAYRNRPHHPELPPMERVLTAQRRVMTMASRYGVGRAPAETSEEVARRWAAEGRTDPDTARRFAELAQSAAFGGVIGPRDGEEAEAVADRLVHGLRASVQTRDRLIAPVRLPAQSVTSAGSSTLQRARELVGTVDREG